jgi:hypothetical protein
MGNPIHRISWVDLLVFSLSPYFVAYSKTKYEFMAAPATAVLEGCVLHEDLVL